MPPPFTSGGFGLDVLRLLETSLKALDASYLRNATRRSFKRAALPGLQGVLVPQEAVYQSELERILRSWLPSEVVVLPQSNAGGRKRSDLIVVPSESTMILLELVASGSIPDIVDHFEYGKLLFYLL